MQAKKLELCVLCHLKSPIPPLLRATQTTFPFLIIFLSTLSNVLCGGFQLSQLISISPCASLLGLLRRDLAEPLPFPSHSPPPPAPSFYFSLLLLFQNQIYIVNLLVGVFKDRPGFCGRLGGGPVPYVSPLFSHSVCLPLHHQPQSPIRTIPLH